LWVAGGQRLPKRRIVALGALASKLLQPLFRECFDRGQHAATAVLGIGRAELAESCWLRPHATALPASRRNDRWLCPSGAGEQASPLTAAPSGPRKAGDGRGGACPPAGPPAHREVLSPLSNPGVTHAHLPRHRGVAGSSVQRQHGRSPASSLDGHRAACGPFRQARFRSRSQGKATGGTCP
jgi:hypothetical protein